MQATGRVLGFLALLLLPLSVYLGLLRPVPAPGAGGAGLDNCGIVLERENPRADPVARALCEPQERDARRSFVMVATANGAIAVAAVILAWRGRR